MGRIYDVLASARVGLGIAAAGGLMLTVPLQTKDLLTGADTKSLEGLLTAVAFLIGTFAWSLTSWFWVRWAVTLHEGKRGPKGGEDWIIWLLPRLVPVLTGAAAVCAGVRANGYASLTAIGAFVAAAVVILIAVGRHWLPNPMVGPWRRFRWLLGDLGYAPLAAGAPRLQRLRNDLAAGPFGPAGTLFALSISVLVAATLGLDPVRWATRLGAGGTTMLAMASVTGPLSYLFVTTERSLRSIAIGLGAISAGQWQRPPIVTVALVLALITAAIPPHFSASMQVDHQVRRLTDEAPPRPDLETVAAAWLQECGPALMDPDGTLRVALVSAAGGASRAALWTASVLARLEILDESFPRRVFAVSSVSGGSLGATAWVAQLREAGLDCTQPGMATREQRADRTFAMLGKDFLAPVMARWLLVDTAWGLAYPFNFIGFHLGLRPWDRAVALEKAWESAWREFGGSDLFAQPFTAIWGPGVHKRLPLLLLNGTMRATGLPVVTSPVLVETKATRGTYDAIARLDGDVAVSTAVTNSARFPFVTPNGVFARRPDSDGRWREDSVVDGGYFDNIGGGTLIQVANTLRQAYARPDVAETLKRHGIDRLAIGVVQISSNPDLLVHRCSGGEAACKAPNPLPVVDVLQRCGTAPGLPSFGSPAANMLDAQLAPILAVIATQSGHTVYRFAELASAFCQTQARIEPAGVAPAVFGYFGFSQCSTALAGYPSLALNWVLPAAARKALTMDRIDERSELPGQLTTCGNKEQFDHYTRWRQRG